MPPDSDLAEDRKRYPRHAALREQSWWAVRTYRLGRQLALVPAGGRRVLADKTYWAVFRVVETVTGISLPREATVGPGLRIHHFGGITVHPDAVLGRTVTLRQGVTIGERYEGSGVPKIGDDVEIGAYAQLLGPITIGDGAKVGALALVIEDVPAGATVVAPAAVQRDATP